MYTINNLVLKDIKKAFPRADIRIDDYSITATLPSPSPVDAAKFMFLLDSLPLNGWAGDVDIKVDQDNNLVIVGICD